VSSNSALKVELKVESVEVISLMSKWMLDPLLPELLNELGKRGYITARVKPVSTGGYNILFIEPNVVAIKGSTSVLYDLVKRSLSVESSDPGVLVKVFDEIEEILKSLGNDPAKGVLFYELTAKAKLSGSRFTFGKPVKMGDSMGVELLVVPTTFVLANGDPNSTRWLHLDVKPIWSSWSSGRVYYELIFICRDTREKLLGIISNFNKILNDIIVAVSEALMLAS